MRFSVKCKCGNTVVQEITLDDPDALWWEWSDYGDGFYVTLNCSNCGASTVKTYLLAYEQWHTLGFK